MRSKVFFRLRREKAKLVSQGFDSGEVATRLAASFGTTVEKLRSMEDRLEARDVSSTRPCTRTAPPRSSKGSRRATSRRRTSSLAPRRREPLRARPRRRARPRPARAVHRRGAPARRRAERAQPRRDRPTPRRVARAARQIEARAKQKMKKRPWPAKPTVARPRRSPASKRARDARALARSAMVKHAKAGTFTRNGRPCTVRSTGRRVPRRRARAARHPVGGAWMRQRPLRRVRVLVEGEPCKPAA